MNNYAVSKKGGIKMPFDGVVAKCVVNELNALLSGGRIEKIFQPEADEVVLHIRAGGRSYRLLLTCNPGYARIHLTQSERENPTTPPMFCMLLRKHLAGGRIVEFEFHDYERIITVHIDSVNELGDVSRKKLLIEIMGRHSNIILLNSEDKIIDAVKHVDSDVSSVREIMPARPYTLPPSQEKTNPEELSLQEFIEKARVSELPMEKFLLENIRGFSPLLCREICFRAGINEKSAGNRLTGTDLMRLENVLSELVDDLRQNRFSPCIIYDSPGEEALPRDFHCIRLGIAAHAKYFEMMNYALDTFYTDKVRIYRLSQKKADLIKVLENNIDRCRKKHAIHLDTLREAADRDRLKLYGELITANIYAIPPGAKSVTLLNYYSENGEYVNIPLDENLTPQENAQLYFKKYAKAKRTYLNAKEQLEENLKELDYLESVLHLLESSTTLQDVEEIASELEEEGYIKAKKKKDTKKKNQEKSFNPLVFHSSDGFEILVGRNNRQNDELTLRYAASGDIWLHTQKIPGSHTIIRLKGRKLTDRALEEAAMLAAFHSKARNSSNVPVDYTTVKNVKKPPGAKPGMVIYDNYRTIIVTPDREIAEKLSKSSNLS